MMNGHDDADMFMEQSLNDTVKEMADIFETNSQGDLVTDEGLEELSNIFRDVHPMDREEVFIEFIKELEERGVEYDITQFRTYDS